LSLDTILSAVREIRAPVIQSEPDIHDLVAQALTQAGIPYAHEVMIAPRCRIDFLADGVGIEIKRSRPNARALIAQATRYLASPRVEALLIISERNPGMPGTMLGKECRVISLSALWGLAVPEGQSIKHINARPAERYSVDSQRETADYKPYAQCIDTALENTILLPAWLKPPAQLGRLYGTLSYQAKGRYWVIKGDPAVTELVKRLFPGADSGKRGVARFSAHRRLVGELNWLMQRYPLAIMPADQERWSQALKETQKHYCQQEVFRLAAPAYQNTFGTFLGTLRPFQEYGASWLCHTKRALLADEMGLGKTVQTLAALASTSGFPAIIVVPPHLVSNWMAEIARFLSFDGTAPRIFVIKGLKPQPLPEADIYLIHYLLLRGWKDMLPEVPVKTVVFDEIQELRHRGTEKYSAASLLANACDRVYGLSGTPVYNHGGEIWNIINILDYHLLGDWDSFTREWCYGYGNAVVIHPDWLGDHLRRDGIMLRRTKKEVLPELPDKRRLVTQVDTDDALFARLMQPVINELRELAFDDRMSPSKRALAENRLSQGERQATGIVKTPYIVQFVRALMENDEKVLLFAHHHAVMNQFKQELKRYSPAFITGRETSLQKEQAVLRFMSGKTNLCCISLRAASGLNLQRASCVVFGELDWSPAVHSQAEDRAHRIGQQDSLLCYYLVSSGGSDSLMQDALGLKVSQFLGLMGENPVNEADAAHGASMARKHVEDMMKRWL
jgi:hypothetical protein